MGKFQASMLFHGSLWDLSLCLIGSGVNFLYLLLISGSGSLGLGQVLGSEDTGHLLSLLLSTVVGSDLNESMGKAVINARELVKE